MLWVGWCLLEGGCPALAELIVLAAVSTEQSEPRSEMQVETRRL